MRTAARLLVCAPLLATLSLAQSNPRQSAPPTATPNPNWRAIHDSAIIIDTHADTPGRFVDENFDLAQDAGTGYLDFNKIKAGNLGAEFFSIWVEPKGNKGHEAKRALDMIDSVHEQARRHPDKMMMAYGTHDIMVAHREHKLAALLGVEGGHAIEGDIRILRDYYRLGVRYMTLTWSNTNDIGDSSGDINDKSVEHHGGLTPFGREVVTEMNRMGMMVDISHVADSTFYQALELSKAPVIASHSSSRALTSAARNMTDDMLKRTRREKRGRAGEFLLRVRLAEVSGYGQATRRAARSRL
jgi:membrane dipeptidase